VGDINCIPIRRPRPPRRWLEPARDGPAQAHGCDRTSSIAPARRGCRVHLAGSCAAAEVRQQSTEIREIDGAIAAGTTEDVRFAARERRADVLPFRHSIASEVRRVTQHAAYQPQNTADPPRDAPQADSGGLARQSIVVRDRRRAAHRSDRAAPHGMAMPVDTIVVGPDPRLLHLRAVGAPGSPRRTGVNALSNGNDQLRVGWLERVALPDWGVRSLRAKIDTGARTSAIHVASLEEIDEGHVRFEVVVRERPTRRTVWVEAETHREAVVKPSSGERQQRLVVWTTMHLGPLQREIEVTLVCRKGMRCRMLIGRTALEGIVVDPNSRYLVSEVKRRRSPKGEQP
jgi:hypothetical protein